MKGVMVYPFLIVLLVMLAACNNKNSLQERAYTAPSYPYTDTVFTSLHMDSSPAVPMILYVKYVNEDSLVLMNALPGHGNNSPWQFVCVNQNILADVKKGGWNNPY